MLFLLFTVAFLKGMEPAHDLNFNLRWAALTDNNNELKRLLEQGANANTTGKNNITVLMSAATRGNNEMVQDLLKAGANPNMKDVNGFTALMRTAKGAIDVAQTLKQ